MSKKINLPQKALQKLSDPMDQLSLRLAEAEEMIRRTYLARIGNCEIVPFEEMNLLPASSETVRFAVISRLVYDNKESTLENLLNIYTAVGSAGYGMVILINSDGKSTELYLGVRSDDRKYLPVESGEKMLEQAIAGHLSGSKYRKLKNQEIFSCEREDTTEEEKKTEYLNLLNKYKDDQGTWAISALAAIPSLKTEEREAFTQGLERFIDAMQGKTYTAVLLADPVMPQKCSEIERGYEQLYSTLSSLTKQQISLGSNENISINRTDTQGITKTISDSVSLSQSHTEGTSWSHTEGESEANTVGATIGTIIPTPLPLFVGGMVSKTKGTNTADTEGGNISDTSGRTDTKGVSESENLNTSLGITTGKGTSTNLSYETHNKSVERLIEKVDQQLKRIDEARAYGLWNVACYFLCDSRESAQNAASLFSGCIRGKDSGVEDSAIIVWGKNLDGENEEKRKQIMEYIQNLHHPRLKLSDNMPKVCPSLLVTGRELALLMHLPRRSVGGVTVIESTGYGRDIHRLEIEEPSKICPNDKNFPKTEKRLVDLGCIRHLFRDDTIKVNIDIDKLVYHSLVTGTTGVGKTTGVMSILKQCYDKDVPFLVVEPAKDEYKILSILKDKGPVSHFQAGRQGDDCLRMNPLVFPEGAAVSLIEHIDRVCALLNAAFPMYAAMPQLLEEAIVQAYEARGWDTLTSKCRSGQRLFPTLREVADLIPTIVERAGYRQEAQSTYVGALTTRLRSLMRGALGFTFMAQEHEETDVSLLFDHSCIVNVSNVGSSEKRAVLMGLLMIRLQEHRVIQGATEIESLRHLMVLEEAHNILKRTTPVGNMEISNPQGQAVEYFSNALAEMRAFGQGFIIVDQSASSLDEAVLKNTNTKITFRAPFEVDRMILGGALALDDKQTKVLATLENHTALVKQNDWLEAVCCHLQKADIKKEESKEDVSPETKRKQINEKECRKAVLIGLFSGYYKNKKLKMMKANSKELADWLKDNIHNEDIRAEVKKQLEEQQKLEIIKIRPLLKEIKPFEQMLRYAELAASEKGVLNNLIITLEEIIGINDQSLVELTHALLRCSERQGLLEEAAEMIENNHDLEMPL